MKWQTFYGVQIEVHELSHQHLSNIKWFYELTLGSVTPMEIMNALTIRFGGIVLPYKPKPSFIYEINILEKKGWISNRHDSDIIVNGKWVGKLDYN